VWGYVPRSDIISRNGITSGYLASLNSTSDKLVIYLQGGGACFNPTTCDINPEQYTDQDGINGAAFLNQTPFAISDRNAPLNQFRDWNHIFVPYSSGDLHSGSNLDADVPFGGPQNQQMQGSANFDKILDDIKQFYPGNSLSEIVVTGSSAGGYGVYLNFPKVAEAYPQAKMTGLIDAGPVFVTDTAHEVCLYEEWQSLFQFVLPADYNTVVTGTYDSPLQGAYEYLSKKYPQHNFGLMADTQDLIIRFFLGFGANECDAEAAARPIEAYEQGHVEIQNTLQNFSNWKVYFDNTNQHTFLGERYLTETVQGVLLRDWVENLTNGSAVDLME